MDSKSMDHYEKQLYTVFKTFDVDNEEALERSAVLALCDALQLEERGAALAESLFERPRERVTFAQFRNGLLSVLGAAPPREVAPRYVSGAKQYGRRSRPASAEPAMQSPAAAPSPAPPPLDHERRIDYEQSLALCRSLHMDSIDRQIVRRIFDDSPTDDMTVGDFFERLNASLSASLASNCSTTDNNTYININEIPLSTEVVIETWESGGVEHARQLLLELGFTAPVLSAGELSRALDRELAALPGAAPDPRALLLQAARLAQRLQLAAAAPRADAALAENSKLRADLAAADRRVAALAQEVDEEHARIEASLQAKLRQAEARREEAARAAAAECAAERERSAAAAAELRGERARGAAELTRLRAELGEAQEAAAAAAARASDAEARAAQLEARCAALAAAARARLEPAPEPAERRESAVEEQLRRENAALLYRCDELCAELEACARRRPRSPPPGPTSCRDELRELALQNCSVLSDECDQSLSSIDERAPPVCPACAALRAGPGGAAPGAAGGVSAAAAAAADAAVQTEPDEELAAAGHEEERTRLTNLVKELESSLEQLKAEYDASEEYWAAKLRDERDAAADEQRLGDERLRDLVDKITEYEEQFTPKHGLPTIEENKLEAQFADLEAEFEAYKREKERELRAARAEAAAREHQAPASPIDYLWAQGTIQAPQRDARPVRDYQNPAFQNKGAEETRCASEGGDRAELSPIRRPERSASAGALRGGCGAGGGCGGCGGGGGAPQVPHMITCSDLEGRLRQQTQSAPRCACPALESRCRQLSAALRQRTAQLAALQKAAHASGAAMRERLAAAEAGLARLHARLAAADLLVKELYIENCQLHHHAAAAVL